MFKTTLLTCLLACAVTANASQADADKRSPEMEAAIELLALMDMDQMMAGMQQQMEAMMSSQMQSVVSCPAMQPVVDAFSRESSLLMTEQFSGESFLPSIAELYVEVFSLEELQGMVEFYRSALGQKLLEKMPELMQRSMVIAEQQMHEIMPKIEEISNRFAAESAAARVDCEDSDDGDEQD